MYFFHRLHAESLKIIKNFIPFINLPEILQKMSFLHLIFREKHQQLLLSLIIVTKMHFLHVIFTEI